MNDLDPQSSDYLTTPDPNPSTGSRRPRGFAATAAATATATGARGKREREKEKERTKLRERHRRAITSRMLAGLRQFGNFPLPARADMNDVLAALAREAGWVVDPDGTTYRVSNPTSQHLVRISLSLSLDLLIFIFVIVIL